jgi:hypothetical protein
VDGRRYVGTFKRSTRVAAGHHFEIAYDPRHPSRNTGSDFAGPLWLKIICWIVVVGVVIGLIYVDRLLKS